MQTATSDSCHHAQTVKQSALGKMRSRLPKCFLHCSLLVKKKTIRELLALDVDARVFLPGWTRSLEQNFNELLQSYAQRHVLNLSNV